MVRTMMHRIIITRFGLFLILASSAAAQDNADRGPNLGALARAGQATLERLEIQAASWTAMTTLPNNTRGVVEVVAAPTMRRTILRFEANGERQEILRIIARDDGLWYVTQGRKTAKYRPWEAPCDFANAYFFLTRSDPRCIVDSDAATLGNYERMTGGIALFRTPIDGPFREQLQKMLQEFETLKREHPAEAARPATVESFDRIREFLEKGLPTKVEVASGMIMGFGAHDKATDFHDFRWLDQIDPKTFDVQGTTWEDFGDDPTTGNTSELLMIGHSGIWKPGNRAGDTDGRLVDLATGRRRRIPFSGSNTLTGCFLKDRRKVVVTGVDALEGSMGLYEIDLATGANRRLGGEPLASGFSLMPAVSPNGTTLSVLHKGATVGVLETQMVLVDLASGAGRLLGEPHDMAFPNWLPDGKGLVLLIREPVKPTDPLGPRVDTIARMDLEGKVTTLRNGTSPLLLNEDRTILFQDAKSRIWQTCDLDGGNVKPYAGGLSGYGFPSPAPDGKRIIMMRFRPGQAPVPMILKIGEGQGKLALSDPGLWVTPAWR